MTSRGNSAFRTRQMAMRGNTAFRTRNMSTNRNSVVRSRNITTNGPTRFRTRVVNGRTVFVDNGFGFGGFGFGYPYYGFGYGFPYYGYYPYGYYGYDYPYNYNYGYYSSTPGYGSYNGSIVIEVQRRLARAGYYRGPIDGAMGPRTRVAIRAYERDHGLRMDGAISGPLMRNMGLRY
jgi:Putative peptidoglycan binding domain